ncbi:sensor histidine kinase [Spartinivicinus ruber]|uniref:sensor histidine kinase n=1 Tax=Spartinivicinus ruber TaxID=2683272 RepID=UPI0013D047CB|nr:ATP-binding protein [Spartinivicinus ruber]
MSRISAIPVWNVETEQLEGGCFSSVSDVCLKQNKKTCKKHYERIKNLKGFHECPAGLSSYNSGESIYSGVRIAGYYTKNKIKNSSSFLPTIPPNVILESVSNSKSIEREIFEGEVQAEFDKDLVDFCLHEVRKYNLIIKRSSEEYLTSKDFCSLDNEKLMKTVFASSSSITNRLNIYDFESNPKIITASTPFQASVFQKFQKASHCLEIYARDAGVRISPFKGRLHTNIDMFPIFDFVPHVLLENAIKYSPSNQTIEVAFKEHSDSFEIKVESIGPSLRDGEEHKIFNKKIRGKNAELVDTSGGGYGLYFAKLICELHNINLAVNVEGSSVRLNNIPYSKFSFVISYNKLHNKALQRTSR